MEKMPVTDYSVIADRYDKNPVRQKEIDYQIKDLMNQNKSLKILDLACGTGNYLKTQTDYYKSYNINWYGMDKSPEMLAAAEKKNPEVNFICSSMENLDENLKSFDYIRNEFAFHHFTDKKLAAEKIYRMLKPGGLFIMKNICPEYINDSWVYHYFPGTAEIDKKRFMPPNKIFKLFRATGFDTIINIDSTLQLLDYKIAFDEALNRDMSQLNLITEKEYKSGIRKMKKDMEEGVTRISDFALLECRCTKK